MRKWIIIICLLSTLFSTITGCGSNPVERKVVVYTSVDQVFSEPIINDFEKQTGIKVYPVYDVEAAKTTGLVNRLIAEKNRPQADVFWNSEIIQTILLKQKGVLATYNSPKAQDIPAKFKDRQGYWTAFGGRGRVLIVNKNRVPTDKCPSSIFDLTKDTWPPDKIGLAYPMFGTSATHAAALYEKMGPAKAKGFFQSIQKRGIKIVDGNSVVRDMVASGQLMWGVTDTDDAAGALSKGASVTVIYPDQKDMGTFIIPNSVGLVAGGPNRKEAQQFIDYLLSVETEQKLLEADFIQIPTRPLPELKTTIPGDLKTMDVDFNKIYDYLNQTKTELAEVFVR
ncbi:MAG: extracellular solute-binding protein [Candidatus Saccharibacteria bacterium]